MGGHPMPIGGGYGADWFDPGPYTLADPAAQRAAELARIAKEAEQAVYASLSNKALLRLSAAYRAAGA